MSPLDEHLVMELAPRVLSRLSHQRHAPESAHAERLTSAHVVDIAAALGMMHTHSLMELDAQLDTMERSEVWRLVFFLMFLLQSALCTVSGRLG